MQGCANSYGVEKVSLSYFGKSRHHGELKLPEDGFVRVAILSSAASASLLEFQDDQNATAAALTMISATVSSNFHQMTLIPLKAIPTNQV